MYRNPVKEKAKLDFLTTDSKAHNKRRICPMAVRRFLCFKKHLVSLHKPFILLIVANDSQNFF